MVQAVLFTGELSAIFVLTGHFNSVILFSILTVCYMSILSVSQTWLGLQMHSNIIEINFLYIISVPWISYNPFLFTFIMRTLICRIMVSCGMGKYLGSKTWRDFTAMNYHYWTQPLPSILSPYFDRLPNWFHFLEVLITFIVEGPLYILIFIPHWSARIVLFLGSVSLLIGINISGNFGHLGLLTLLECLPLLTDEFWSYFIPFEVQRYILAEGFYSNIFYWFSWSIAILYTLVSIISLLSISTMQLPKEEEIQNHWIFLFWFHFRKTINLIPEKFGEHPVFKKLTQIYYYAQHWRLCNRYSKFAGMTDFRWEFIIEGSSDGEEWEEYITKYKPGPLDRPLPWIFPGHMPCLDWMLWFVPLHYRRGNPVEWYDQLIFGLYEGSKDICNLFEYCPYTEKNPPKFLRTKVYSYTYADNGNTWERAPVGILSHANK
eukprot:TRINITY_DN4971_c0_g1_i2.p1 TRINITY_DN4971_c0_g1~~TRINITY_DN4971_c0_g1_i2.p1  ORF type:complete len:433 (+),score=37.74 TRINITY_DN4971_c0_g1_i2:251-1549(+)